MPRWHQDDVDIAAECWAYQWVANFAKDPDRAARTVGAIVCTLGRVHELHDGAGSSTEHRRTFPEVFLGTGLVIAVALKAMSFNHRELIWRHYVERVYDPTTWKPLKYPTKQRVIAERLGLSVAEYYSRRDAAKSCLRTALYLDTKDLCHARAEMLSTAEMGSLPVAAR